ncbi:hypothetical protein [Desulfofustis limnaeus]|jgi:hypothetical protein|uniref:Uncharacterized protein n=1 Tax=Desulfofustis limnaeus TaxID=2740163 RepID=A0ABM7WDA1_9BACT|nr:hypothetical protein [Desulfofustis limnaeus]MDX9895168.1 hypothetical protein [Desulfofustis sp.]BDD88928.1 hypothetical protein DPPLL_32930 [Desulfofustis limnaeus]
MATRTTRITGLLSWSNQKGQSAVEYLVVVGVLVTSLIAAPSLFSMVRTMMFDKYRSYSFGVAISDPPSSAFDREVEEDADKVKKVMTALHDLEQFIEHPSWPEPGVPDWPGKKVIEDFEHLLHEL